MEKKIGWPQPGGGLDKALEDHMNFRDSPGGPTRREVGRTAQKAIDDSLAAIKTKASSLDESLIKSKTENAEIARAAAEIARLQ
jgi:hypothetical protein